jgi:predicted nucleic acid-binding protein
MSAERYTFDTNILFYALDSQAGTKHALASHLIASADYERAVLMLQTLAELCNSFRKKRPASLDLAYDFVQENARLFDVAHALPADLNIAMHTARKHNIPFWDAMLWATAGRAGCTLLLSEDLQDGRTLCGVTIRNPFAKGFAMDAL